MPSGNIELRSGDAYARVSLLGGECLEWSIAQRNLLWRADPLYWDRTAPVLFPVCGWTRHAQIRVGGRTYPLGLHGFAPSSTFQIDDLQGGGVRVILRDCAETRALYPFAFELAIDYRLEPRALSIIGHVRNTGPSAMPYAFGLHPGFRLEPPGVATIVFDEPEATDVPVIAPGGLFSSRRRPVDFDGRRLELRPDTFAREALCFVPARSRGLRLLFADGSALRADYPGFDHLVLWSRPGAPFLCLEPWTGYGDPEDFDGELADKPGMRSLAPGAVASHGATFRFEPA